ncbi:hypothetical protein [Actinoplanes sp. TFC3]|uniref:hypothetical protein n=1 Tax=Actinoplanes sp. TFC3 TaxID=1710355 RepID=UPI000829943E|nr:hypothetical protein [Actinoplanes sp. TFC3]
MRLHTLLGRVALPVVLTALATTGAALPAHAGPGDLPAQPEAMLVLPDRVVAVGGKSKTIEFSVFSFGAKPAEGLSVKFGSATHPVPASVGLTLPKSCTDTGCPLEVSEEAKLSFTVSPTAALPKLGETFEVSVQDAAGVQLDRTHVTVISAKSGVDLEMKKIDDLEVAPGKSATVPVVIHNSGTEVAKGVGVVLAGSPFLEFPAKYSNCSKVDDLFGIVCMFNDTIAAGQTFTLADRTPLKIKVAADAPGPADYFAGAYAGSLDDLDLDAPAADQAGQLSLEPVMQAQGVAPKELNDWDNARTFVVKVPDNPADNVAIGGTFTGPSGATRTVKVGLRNDGPAATNGPLQGWVTLVDVTVPKGVKVTKVDPYCEADGDRKYVCVSVQNVRKGERALFSFTATIVGASDPGSVKVNGGKQDPQASNDTAELAVELETGGEGGGGGLPVTGAPGGWIVGGGSALLLAGAIALWTARRRRIITLAE